MSISMGKLQKSVKMSQEGMYPKKGSLKSFSRPQIGVSSAILVKSCPVLRRELCDTIYTLYNPIYYSSFHFLFHYPHITPI